MTKFASEILLKTYMNITHYTFIFLIKNRHTVISTQYSQMH